MSSITPTTAKPAQTTTKETTTASQATATQTTTGGAAAQRTDARVDSPKVSEPPPANRGDLPPVNGQAGPPDGPGYAQPVLDKAFKKMEELEAELKTLDPTKPAGQMRMMEIERLLQRVDQMVTMVTNMRRMIHEMNMQSIRSIVS